MASSNLPSNDWNKGLSVLVYVYFRPFNMSPFEAGDKASGQGRARISSLKQKKVETRPEKEYTLNMTKVCLKKFFSLAFVVLFSTNALSEEATEWQASDYVESRLIASHKAVPDATEGPLYVGWHVTLAENWKT